MGCGICVTRCDQGALTLRLAPERGIPLDLAMLLPREAEAEVLGWRRT
jgi:ferredoxin